VRAADIAASTVALAGRDARANRLPFVPPIIDRGAAHPVTITAWIRGCHRVQHTLDQLSRLYAWRVRWPRADDRGRSLAAREDIDLGAR
jgi:hypothetical protein